MLLNGLACEERIPHNFYHTNNLIAQRKNYSDKQVFKFFLNSFGKLF